VAGPGPLQQQEMAGEFAVTYLRPRAGKLLRPQSADGQKPKLQDGIPFNLTGNLLRPGIAPPL